MLGFRATQRNLAGKAASQASNVSPAMIADTPFTSRRFYFCSLK
jgi:hypothetical protein